MRIVALMQVHLATDGRQKNALEIERGGLSSVVVDALIREREREGGKGVFCSEDSYDGGNSWTVEMGASGSMRTSV